MISYCFVFLAKSKQNTNSIERVSSAVPQNAIKKSTKHYRSRPIIARKIVAFQELINLKTHQHSARHAADLLARIVF
ncbi:MAG: hypothetical protein A2Y28_02165 [Chlamydiae bacterium GWC2_50_10]|nr:MAG: hypothetical protein A2Y28_02165 [Chlamydiae bacterium GWC2_50_10]